MLSNEFIVEHAKPWLLFLEGLQGLGIANQELAVPQIAVFGDQSSGKSSLLESISGIPFPKGTGLVTRCPTRISMVHAADEGEWIARVELPESYHADHLSKPIQNPNDLAAILSEAASLLTANSLNGFSRDCIHVKVRSPHVPDLTLIDLPGIIRTTTAGQDKSVIAEVDNLLAEYMTQSETVILAVIPSNQDIATVDILERANRYDPSGERTIGVLTKPDLIDRGGEEEVLKILQNVRKPLKLGYIMVRNRNQMELKSTSITLQDNFQLEDQYFQNHEIWKLTDPKVRGIKSLCNKLTSLIVSRTMDKSATIKYQLQEKNKEVNGELQELGGLGADTPKDDASKRKYLIKLITRYTQTLRQISNGDYRDPIPTKYSSFRLKYFVNEVLIALQKELTETVPNFQSKEYAQKLKATISEMRGRELPGFGSTRLLLATVAQELDCWRSLVEDKVLSSFDLYTTVSEGLADKLAGSFPKLNSEIRNSVTINMNKQMEIITRRVDEMFDHSVEGTSSDQELINTINSIRFGRFDQTLREALMVITNNLKHIHEMGIPMTANTIHRATSAKAANSNNNLPPPQPENGYQQQQTQQPQQSAANSPVNPTNRPQARNSISQQPPQSPTPQPQNGQSQSPNPHQQQQAQQQNNQQVQPRPDNGPQISKEELKSYITDILGNAYMSIHGLDYGTLLQLDEAVAVLQSYWRINEKRINEEVQSIIDLILLQQCSENIEKDLLVNVQLFLADNDKLNDLFLEDPVVTQKRNDLLTLKTKIEKLLIELEKLAPLKPEV